MAIFSKPKTPAMPKVDNSALIAQQKALTDQQKALAAKQEEQLKNAEAERISKIRERLRDETYFGKTGGGRQSLLTKGRTGFSLRGLLGQ